MIRSNSSTFSKNSSRVGKAIKDSSFTGTPSCFSGGRKIVKCTKSTLLSDFNKLRQVRSPAWGSPLTSSTRRRSRTPLIWITASLLRSVNSPSMKGVANCMTFMPPWGRSIGNSTSSFTGIWKDSGAPPSIAMLSPTRPVSGAAPWSSTRKVRVTGSPRIAKAGALLTTRRRSQSSSRPVSNTCSGAGRTVGAAGRSCTRPSVSNTMPATRAWGSSANASDRVVMSSVPASPSPSPKVRTRNSVLGRRVTSACRFSKASDVWLSRSEIRWLALSSTNAITMSDRLARSSCCKLGFAMAPKITMAAKARRPQPRSLRQTAKINPTAASAARA